MLDETFKNWLSDKPKEDMLKTIDEALVRWKDSQLKSEAMVVKLQEARQYVQSLKECNF